MGRGINSLVIIAWLQEEYSSLRTGGGERGGSKRCGGLERTLFGLGACERVRLWIA